MYSKEHYAANRERICAAQTKYRNENREIVKARARSSRAVNREKVNAQKRAHYAANIDEMRAKLRTRREKNPEVFRQSTRRWQDADPERYRAANREYYSKNSERVKQQKREYYHNNREECVARAGFYNTIRRRLIGGQEIAKAHRKETRAFILACPPGYEVDHRVPLRGKNVCGLHVPWNLQYLPVLQNRSKGNRFRVD